MRALGIDPGDVRIGVAGSDVLGILAHPLETVAAQPLERAFIRIGEIADQRQAEIIVVGLPVREDGTEGTAAEKSRRFAAGLMQELPPHLVLAFQDEYGSTQVAAAQLRAAGRRIHTQRAIIDQAAAVVILQTWMDAHAAKNQPPMHDDQASFMNH